MKKLLGKEIKMKKISTILSILLLLTSNSNAFNWNISDYLNPYNFYATTTDYGWICGWNTLEISYE